MISRISQAGFLKSNNVFNRRCRSHRSVPPVNVSKITNTFKSVVNKDITDDTVANFVGCYEDAFVVSKAKNITSRVESIFSLLYRWKKKKSLYYIDDSFKKIVVAKTGLKPFYDEKGIVTIVSLSVMQSASDEIKNIFEGRIRLESCRRR